MTSKTTRLDEIEAKLNTGTERYDEHDNSTPESDLRYLLNVARAAEAMRPIYLRALAHQTARNHKYSPDSCDACEDAAGLSHEVDILSTALEPKP